MNSEIPEKTPASVDAGMRFEIGQIERIEPDALVIEVNVGPQRSVEVSLEKHPDFLGRIQVGDEITALVQQVGKRILARKINVSRNPQEDVKN